MINGVQLNVPLINYTTNPWYPASTSLMNWVFGGTPMNTNYQNSMADYLLNIGYSTVPVRVISGDSDNTVGESNNTGVLSNIYYNDSTSYFEWTSISGGGHSDFSDSQPNQGYMYNFFDLLRTNNNNLSNVPYIQIKNANNSGVSSDILRSNVTETLQYYNFTLTTRTNETNINIKPLHSQYGTTSYIYVVAQDGNSKYVTITPSEFYIVGNITSGVTSNFNLTPTKLSIIPSSDSINITVTTWNTTNAGFNESSSNATNEVQYHLGFIPNSNYTVKTYWNNGTKFQDFYIISNATGYLNYNSTGFEYPRYTVITQEVPSSPYTVWAIAVTVIIGGITYILKRFKIIP